MTLDFTTVKEYIRDRIKDYVYPYSTSYSSSLDASSTINQPFIPFSSKIDAISIYSHTTGEGTIKLLSAGSTLYSTISTFSTGWNTFSTSLTGRVSKRACTLSVSGAVQLGAGSASYYYGTVDSSYNLAFSISVPDFVHTAYPIAKSYSYSSLPIVVVDISSRPAIADKYLSPPLLIESLDIAINVYSRYPDEIDLLCSGIENGFVSLRRSLPVSNWIYLAPYRIGDLSFISPDIYYRDIHLLARLLVQGK